MIFKCLISCIMKSTLKFKNKCLPNLVVLNNQWNTFIIYYIKPNIFNIHHLIISRIA